MSAPPPFPRHCQAHRATFFPLPAIHAQDNPFSLFTQQARLPDLSPTIAPEPMHSENHMSETILKSIAILAQASSLNVVPIRAEESGPCEIGEMRRDGTSTIGVDLLVAWARQLHHRFQWVHMMKTITLQTRIMIITASFQILSDIVESYIFK